MNPSLTITYFDQEKDGDRLWSMYQDLRYKDFFRCFGPSWNKDSMLNSDDQAGIIFYTIRYADKFVGFVCLSEVSAFAKSCNLGIVLVDKYQDYRIGKRDKLAFLVMRKIGQTLFEEQNFNRVVCKISTERPDLMDNLIQAHFIFEGQLEQSVFTDGQFKNEYQLALLAKDYFTYYKPTEVLREVAVNDR